MDIGKEREEGWMNSGEEEGWKGGEKRRKSTGGRSWRCGNWEERRGEQLREGGSVA